MPLHDASYKHWDGVHIGLWERRWVIAKTGLAACLQTKLMRQAVTICWAAALGMTALLFMVGQLLVTDSIVVKWAATFNPQLQSFVRFLTGWLEQHPEISVRTTQDLLFFFFCIWLMPVSIFALGMAIPLLITRDLASNAIIIYSSKAVSRGDYLLGKFATAFGLLTLTWLGPVLAAWLVGNLLAPDWRFFWHSRAALVHALIFVLSGMTVLSMLGLGISSISSKEKSATAFWFLWWILGGVLAPFAAQTLPGLKHLSFKFNLDQIALAVFQLGDDLKIAQDNIPVFGNMLRTVRPQTMAALTTPATTGAIIGLVLMMLAAVVLVSKRVKPE